MPLFIKYFLYVQKEFFLSLDTLQAIIEFFSLTFNATYKEGAVCKQVEEHRGAIRHVRDSVLTLSDVFNPVTLWQYRMSRYQSRFR